MEYKLKNSFKYYGKDGNNEDEAITIVFNEEKFNIAKVQRALAIFMNDIALKMLSNINTSKNNDDVIKAVKTKSLQEEITEYKAIGFNLFSFLDIEKCELILKLMLKNGCLYYKEEQDLATNDKFIDTLDIVDIYVILGYYFINFTAKQLV